MAYTSSAASGLSIYFPSGNADNILEKLEYYGSQGIDYNSFINTYMSIALGGQAYASGSFDTNSEILAASYPWYDSALADTYATLYYETYRYNNVGMHLWWKEDHYALALFEGDEDKLTSITLRTYIDTGSSYVLLGNTAMATRDADADAVAAATDEWLAVNGRNVPYTTYVTGTTEYYLVPVYLNEAAAMLVIVKDDTTPEGRVTGAILTKGPYSTFVTIASGDVISFRYEFYNYDNSSVGENVFGIKIAIADTLRVTTESVNEGDVLICCTATDIYGDTYFSSVVNIREAVLING